MSPTVPKELVRYESAVPPAFEIITASPVNDDTPVPPSVTAKSFVNVTVPVTLKLSSTVTVPPAESIVRLPDTVSISLSPVIPTCILPMSAPVAYTSPNSASLQGDEKSSDVTVSSFVKTNLSD